MRDLSDLDPLPKFEADTYCLAGGVPLPESKRQRDEYLREWAKKSGEDWQPYKRDGQIVPHTYINGQGKLKTEGYQPPEPPETDIPVGCVLQTVAPLSSREMYLEYQRVEQEAGIEAAARKLVELSGYRGEPLRWRTPDGRSIDMGFDGWYPHKPGDPRPCDPEQVVWIKLRDGTLYEGDEAEKAVYWEWRSGAEQDNDYDIIAWKPAT
jgi:hypothetical protein